MTVEFEPISVEYLDHMGDDKRVCNVARVSFNKWSEDEINEKDTGLLAYLATGLPSAERDDWEKRAKAHTHWSPFSHCFLSIRMKIPIWLARQLVKHSVGLNWNEVSRRYVKEEVTLWCPDVIHKAPEHAKQGASEEIHTQLMWAYNDGEGDVHLDAKELIQYQTEQSVMTYNRLVAAGVAPEEARIVLPQNAMTTVVWSGSLAAFNRVYQQRIDSHAQTGAREFAAKLGEILYKYFPHSMEALNA